MPTKRTVLACAPFSPCFLDEADLRADDQAVEGPVENGVAVKVDFTTVRRFDESAIFPGEEFRHAAMVLRHVFLDLTAHVARDVFDLPHRRVESLPDRDQSVLALGRVAMGLADDDVVMLGHGDANIDLEETALAGVGSAAQRPRHDSSLSDR